MPGGTVHKPHCGNEAHGAKHTDGREIFHRVQTVFFQDGECRRVGKCQSGHIESHTQGVGGDKHCLVGGGTSLSHHKQSNHSGTCQQMANAQQTLRLNPFICHNAHQCGHENRHDTLNGVEPRDFRAHTCLSKVVAHTCEIRSPNSKLEEIHHNQSKLQILHFGIMFFKLLYRFEVCWQSVSLQ